MFLLTGHILSVWGEGKVVEIEAMLYNILNAI